MSRIPLFPEGRAVTLADKALFDRAFAFEAPGLSEYTFTNIFSWRHAYRFEVSAFGGMLVLSSQEAQRRVFYDPLGRGDKAPVVRRILACEGASFVRLPEATMRVLAQAQGLQVSVDADNADYLYLAQDLIALAGRKYDGKRNLIKKFKSSYAYEYIDFDARTITDALPVAEQWCLIKGCDTAKSLTNEKNAIIEMVANFSALGFRAAGIKAQGVTRAFIFAEKLNGQTMVVHMLKAAAEITGLYQTMLNEFLARQPRDFRYVNLEQDLGLPGLRKAKQSYHPVRMVEKYRARLAP